MNLDLDTLEAQARESESATMPGVYFAVLVPGDVLLELVRLVRLDMVADPFAEEPP